MTNLSVLNKKIIINTAYLNNPDSKESLALNSRRTRDDLNNIANYMNNVLYPMVSKIASGERFPYDAASYGLGGSTLVTFLESAGNNSNNSRLYWINQRPTTIKESFDFIQNRLNELANQIRLNTNPSSIDLSNVQNQLDDHLQYIIQLFKESFGEQTEAHKLTSPAPNTPEFTFSSLVYQIYNQLITGHSNENLAILDNSSHTNFNLKINKEAIELELDDLLNVNVTSAQEGDVLSFDGQNWIPVSNTTGNITQFLDVKNSVRAATSQYSEVSIVDILNPPSIIDGVTLNIGDRILLKDQDVPPEGPSFTYPTDSTNYTSNGIYTYNGPGVALTRSEDANSNEKFTAGLFTFVTEGTVNADTGWIVVTNDPIDLDVTSVQFAKFATCGCSGGSGTTYFAGTGIEIQGNTISVNNFVPLTNTPQTFTEVNTFQQEIIGSISGNASTADSLKTPINISLTGDVIGSQSNWDGSSDIEINTTVVFPDITLGTQTNGNYIESISSSNEMVITNSTPASDGKNLNLSLATTGVIAGVYKSLSVDIYGRVLNGTNPTTIAGYGITDALNKNNNLSDLSNISQARINLGLAIGSNVQAYDPDLSSIAGLIGTSGYLKKTAANTWILDDKVFVDTTTVQTVGGTKTFSNTINASISGNSSTANALQTSQNFSISGAVTAPNVSFNGTSSVTLNTTIPDSSIANSKLINKSITISDSNISEAIELGQTINFTGTANKVTVGYTAATNTMNFSLPTNITANASTASDINGLGTTGIVKRTGNNSFTTTTILNDLSDVVISNPVNDQVLFNNGTNWINGNISSVLNRQYYPMPVSGYFEGHLFDADITLPTTGIRQQSVFSWYNYTGENIICDGYTVIVGDGVAGETHTWYLALSDTTNFLANTYTQVVNSNSSSTINSKKIATSIVGGLGVSVAAGEWIHLVCESTSGKSSEMRITSHLHNFMNISK